MGFQYNMVDNLEYRDSAFYGGRPHEKLTGMPRLPQPLMKQPLSGFGLPKEQLPLSTGDWGYGSSLHVRKSPARQQSAAATAICSEPTGVGK